ncbi:valine--tRNA ligase [Candidatus Woesearchaeota archaeon]|nr:valine--tRNA ligase [Candidatus Woesearchaeota archaeon]
MGQLTDHAWQKEFEQPIYAQWKADKRYAFNTSSKRKIFSIDTPPPYVNTPVHIGQATTYVLMDFFARFHRMLGEEVLFPLGLDRNGLPIEMAAEKRFNIKLNDVSREEFIGKCYEVLDESSAASTESFLRLGISFNSWNVGTGIGDVYETDSADYRSLTQDTFIDLYQKGLIYEDERVNNYCPGCQTTLADAEVEYEERPGHFYDIVFTCKETGEQIIISTTRPELICSLGMIIFNPEDTRYQKLAGKTAISPLYHKEVPIRAHPSAEMDKGTGIMMMCSFGDLTDIRFFREESLQPLIAINKEGKMNEHAGFLAGLSVAEARKVMVQKLDEEGLLARKTPAKAHRTPVCERSKDPIEFIAMKEFYVKQVECKEKMKALAHQLHVFHESSRQILLDWIQSVSIDWPITRRRYYATEVPLWYCNSCSKAIVPPKGKYYQPWKEDPPVKKCACGSASFRGETRVFDTWFDSSISPLYILKYSRNDAFFRKSAPCTLRPQGKEIVRTWLYYTLLKCYLLTGKLIFRDAWINYHIVDEKGHKMSKSKGNVIDPKAALDKFGAEPFRLWAAIEGNLEQGDFRCSFERIEGAQKTLSKLWNVARFVSLFPEAKKATLQEADQWIIRELHEIAAFAREHYAQYDFHNPATRLKHFVWETFASHYLELVKSRAYNRDAKFTKAEQDAALFTLHYCLDTLLKLLAPIIPLITAKIYYELRNKDIHAEQFPKPAVKAETEITADDIINLNSEIWKSKKSQGKSLKSEIASLTIPKKLKGIAKDLQAMHQVKEMRYGERVEIVV